MDDGADVRKSWAPTDPLLGEVLRDPTEPLVGQFTGTFVMVSPHESKVYGVEFLPPDRWRIQVDRDPFSGLVTDGTTHVAVDLGDVLWRSSDAHPVVSHRLRNMFFPKMTFDWRGATVKERRHVIRNGRETWELDTEVPDGPASTLLVDVDTGVLVGLRDRSGPERIEMYDFAVTSPDPQRFTWEGPLQRRLAGIAYVAQSPADEMTPERVNAHWDVRVGPDWNWVLSVDGPESTDIQELVEWARSHAEAVSVRIDGQYYSAGTRQPPGAPYPRWQDR
jgi:hypothetical protein